MTTRIQHPTATLATRTDFSSWKMLYMTLQYKRKSIDPLLPHIHIYKTSLVIYSVLFRVHRMKMLYFCREAHFAEYYCLSLTSIGYS